MIRVLRLKGQSYRSIAHLLGISSGSVSLEIKMMKKEIAEGKYQAPNANQKTVVTPSVNPKTNEPDEEPRIELDLGQT